MSEAETGQPFWVKCGACKHAWIAACLPIEAEAFADVAKQCCPICGNGPKNVFIAKQKNGVLSEPAGLE